MENPVHDEGAAPIPPALARLEADLAAAEAEVASLRTENSKLADGFRADPSDARRGDLKRAASALAASRDRADAARVAVAVFKKTGTPHGLVADEGRVIGTVAVQVPPGMPREARERAIDAVLSTALADAAEELGVVLAAAPERYTREQPGRDPEGRTVLEVIGRVEGDRLVPAVSRAAKNMRR